MAYWVIKFSGKKPKDLPVVANTPIVRGVQAIVKKMPARKPAAHEIGPAINKRLKKKRAEMAEIMIAVL